MEFNPLERQALSKDPVPASNAEEVSNVVQMPQASDTIKVTDSFGNFLGTANTQEEANNLIRQAADDRREAA